MCMPPHLIYSVLETEPGALHVLGKHSTNCATSPLLLPSDASLARLVISHPIPGTWVAWLHNLLLPPQGI